MKRVGLVCRWKPVHLGHAHLLEALCERFDEVLIGIGSSNRRSARNPFSAEETARMIDLVLAPRFENYSLFAVPDLDDPPRWARMVAETFGPLDVFVTENDWVRGCIAAHYPVVHPGTLVPREKHVAIDGTMVRDAIARGADWRSLVPAAVASYLEGEGLIERFRREYGLLVLAEVTP